MKPESRQLLQNSNFRRLVTARLVSNIGNGMAPIALAFGVLALPGSTPTSLSIVLAAQAVTLLVLLPFTGVLADRIGAARLIGGSDMALGVLLAFEAWLFISGNVTIPVLVVLSMVSGALNALWYPSFIGLTPDTVEEHLLQAANGFIALATNVGYIAGNAIGGLLVAFVGAGWAIAIDAATFVVAGVLVFSFRHVSRPHHSGESMWGDISHGWRVFISFRWVVVVVACFSVVVMAWRGGTEVMGPVLAKESYGGAAGWALILGFQTVGYLIGGFVGARRRFSRPIFTGMAATLTLPVFFGLMAIRAPLPIVLVGALMWGIAMELFSVLWFTALQSNVPRESLSRVSSYDMFGSLMFGPIGLGLAGPLIAFVGVQAALVVTAIVTLIPIVAALFSRSVRSVRSVTAPSAVSGPDTSA